MKLWIGLLGVVMALSLTASEVNAQQPPVKYVLGVTTTFVKFARPFNGNYYGGEKITSVNPGSPAANAGLKQGDILVTAGFKVLKKHGLLYKEIQSFVGNKVNGGQLPYLPVNYIDRQGKLRHKRVEFSTANFIRNK